MSFKIEKNIELPERYKKAHKKYPLEEMDVTDSFFIPYKDEHQRTVQSRVSASITKYAKETNTKFTIRSLEEGIRVWRIK